MRCVAAPVRNDLRNAGAEVVDEEVVTDGTITTSRSTWRLARVLRTHHLRVRGGAAWE